MDLSRRQALQSAGAFGAAFLALGLLPARASAAIDGFNAAAVFQAKSLAEAFKALGTAAPEVSRDVVITSADIAENGQVVPVAIRSALPRTDLIALLVDKNPNVLAGAYGILDGAEADVGMRIKMGQSSDVVALVRADGKYYLARKEIKVTMGGCGG